MKLLNLGCGGNRPIAKHWVNIDNLHALFPDKTMPERQHMDTEPNYLNADLTNGIPLEDASVDGILCSHILEHLDCHESIRLLRECLRVLKADGVLRISLPDPKKFYELSMQNCMDWGEPNPSSKSFIEYALFFEGHKQHVSEDALLCMLFVAGYDTRKLLLSEYRKSFNPYLSEIDNRPVFSTFYEVKK